MRIELIYAPECPLAAQTRVTVQRCLDRLDLRVPVNEAIAQDLPSPTVLVDGVDVMGQPAAPGRSCRLDVPSEDRLLAALSESSPRSESRSNRKGDSDAPA